MVQTIQASDINLWDLKRDFNLSRRDDPEFFWEWQRDLPTISEVDKAILDSVKQDYLHLSEYSMTEAIAKMVVLSPLLKLAGFYRPPFYLVAEKSVEIQTEDQQTIVKGRLDALVFTPEFWVLVIEAKRSQFSVEVGIPQVLSYMLASSNANTQPTFGLVTNGREFQFLKLIKGKKIAYSLSDLFSLYRGDDLYLVLQILRSFISTSQISENK